MKYDVYEYIGPYGIGIEILHPDNNKSKEKEYIKENLLTPHWDSTIRWRYVGNIEVSDDLIKLFNGWVNYDSWGIRTCTYSYIE